jgi:hypothetical protein
MPNPRAPDPEVRSALAERYAAIASQLSDERHTSWRDRLDAVVGGQVLVEPGWMLRPIVGDDVDIFGFYRVYADGRIERDRFLEQREHARHRGAARAHEPATRSDRRLLDNDGGGNVGCGRPLGGSI